MKVIHLSYSDMLGGAAIAAWRLHRGLSKIGVDSRMRVRFKYSGDDTIEAFTPPVQANLRVKRILRRWQIKQATHGLKNLQAVSDDRSENGGIESANLGDYEAVNLHWASGFVDVSQLFRQLPKDIPIVVTMHDMNPFTGGCHYNMDCDRFTQQCGNCPQLGSRQDVDATRSSWQRKQQAYYSRDIRKISFVANSHWTAMQAQRSSLLKGLPVRVIHYGLNTDVFRPLSKQFARSVFGIPDGMPVVMFGAASVENERKGIQHLKDALAAMVAKPFLLTFGAGHPPRELHSQGIHLGVVENEHLLTVAYNAADVFVIPSLQEAFGQTALEAMACATPVIGFRTGGIPDMVEDGITGMLCNAADTKGLASAMSTLLSNRDFRLSLGTNAQRVVNSKFRLDQQANNYFDLYKQLIEAD